MEMKKKPNPKIFGISVLGRCNAERMALAAACLIQLPDKAMRKGQII